MATTIYYTPVESGDYAPQGGASSDGSAVAYSIGDENRALTAYAAYLRAEAAKNAPKPPTEAEIVATYKRALHGMPLTSRRGQ